MKRNVGAVGGDAGDVRVDGFVVDDVRLGDEDGDRDAVVQQELAQLHHGV